MAIPAAIEIAGTIIDGAGQQKAHEENKKNAMEALQETYKTISLRAEQETESAQQSIMAIDRQAREADALARVTAGESGVAGASVDALLSSFQADAGQARMVTERNLQGVHAQLRRERAGAQAATKSRIASVPEANPFLAGLRIGGSAAKAGTNLMNLPKPGGKK